MKSAKAQNVPCLEHHRVLWQV